MKAQKGASNFVPVELPQPQTTVARCYSVIHLGHVPSVYKGTESKPDKVYITWELPKHLAQFNKDKGNEPFVVGLELTLSTKDNSNFAKLIAQWRNKPLTADEETQGFDPSKMLGKTCLLAFTHKLKKDYVGKSITKVTNENTAMAFNAIMQKPKEMECPEVMNPYFIWDWEVIIDGKEKFDVEKFKKIPKFLQTKMMTSDEFKKYGAPFMPREGEDDVPAASNTPVAGDSDGWD